MFSEIDLASRYDEASYKPNPWTIARINAATRLPAEHKLLARMDVEKIEGEIGSCHSITDVAANQTIPIERRDTLGEFSWRAKIPDGELIRQRSVLVILL
jgi:hypothetical protein